MEKMRRARYTLEYKLEALRLIGAGQSIAAVAATLGLGYRGELRYRITAWFTRSSMSVQADMS